jgi:hypothetical protein
MTWSVAASSPSENPRRPGRLAEVLDFPSTGATYRPTGPLQRSSMGTFVRELLTSAFYFAIPCLFLALILGAICDALWQHTLREKLAHYYKYAHSHLHFHFPR